MYPACVNGVQSDMLKGTSNTRASVLAIKVLPTPEGPSIRIFDLSTVSGLWSCNGGGDEARGDEGKTVAGWPGNSSRKRALEIEHFNNKPILIRVLVLSRGRHRRL